MTAWLRVSSVALTAAVSVVAAGCAGGSPASGERAAVRPAAPGFTTAAIQVTDGKLEATRFTLSQRADAVSVLYFSFVG